MKTINLTNKKIYLLQPFTLPEGVMATESEILKFNYNKNYPGIIKKVSELFPCELNNKLYTLQELDKKRELFSDIFVIPEHIVTVKDNVIGFTMPRIDGINLQSLLNDINISIDNQLLFIKQIGEILNELERIRKNSNISVYVNDLHEANFVANLKDNKLFVLDVDSFSVENNKPTSAKYLTPFALLNNISDKYNINTYDNSIAAYVIPDKNSDLYCYCIVILNYLCGDNINNVSEETYYEYLNYLESIKINQELINCFYKILSKQNNENPLNYLNSLTNKQIVKSRKKIK